MKLCFILWVWLLGVADYNRNDNELYLEPGLVFGWFGLVWEGTCCVRSILWKQAWCSGMRVSLCKAIGLF